MLPALSNMERLHLYKRIWRCSLRGLRPSPYFTVCRRCYRCFGKLDPSRVPCKQLDGEFSFQIADLLAQRGL